MQSVKTKLDNMATFKFTKNLLCDVEKTFSHVSLRIALTMDD